MITLIFSLLTAAALCLLIPSLYVFCQVVFAVIGRAGVAAEVGEISGNADRPTVAVLMPAHNEQTIIADSIRSLLPQLNEGDRLTAAGSIDRLAATSFCPVQALYLMRSKPNAGLKTRIAEFAWVIINQVRPLGLWRIGLPCQLMGTGMALFLKVPLYFKFLVARQSSWVRSKRDGE